VARVNLTGTSYFILLYQLQEMSMSVKLLPEFSGLRRRRDHARYKIHP
jgi:hypothetical protein